MIDELENTITSQPRRGDLFNLKVAPAELQKALSMPIL